MIILMPRRYEVVSKKADSPCTVCVISQADNAGSGHCKLKPDYNNPLLRGETASKAITGTQKTKAQSRSLILHITKKHGI